MKRIILSIGFLSLIILLAACHSTKPLSTGASGERALLSKNRWRVEEIQGEPLTNTSGNLPDILFSTGQLNKVNGSTGCNKFNGSFQLTGANIIKFSPLATTKMACAPNNNIESKFLTALDKVNNWSIINDELLLSNGKILRMKLKAITSEAGLLDGNWELNYISGPRIAFNGLYPDKKPIIHFNLPEKELGGNTTCNGFSSKIIMEGNKISIAEPFAKTMIFCEGGGETTFLMMLKKVNRFAVTAGNTLTFLIDDVAIMRFTKK